MAETECTGKTHHFPPFVPGQPYFCRCGMIEANTVYDVAELTE